MSSAAEYDVLVVGAGPAGSTTAARFVRQGFSVLLLDKASFPRDKVCGEGLMPPGVGILRELGLLERLEATGRPFRAIRFLMPNGAEVALDFSTLPGAPTGRIFPRFILDDVLLSLARKAGAEVRLRTAARGVSCKAEGVEAALDTTHGAARVHARLLIVADGIQSKLPRQLGFSVTRARRPRYGLRALYQRYEGDGDRVDVHCSNLGEAYVAPREGGALVTFLLSSGRGVADLGETLASFPRLSKRLSGLREETVQARAPLGLRRDRAHGNRVLLVGDAAGAVDPITGQGITIALRDALLAADLGGECLRQDRLSSTDLAPYTEERNRYFRPAFDFAEMLVGLLSQPRRRSRGVRSLNRNSSLRRRITEAGAGVHLAVPVSWLDQVRMFLGV